MTSPKIDGLSTSPHSAHQPLVYPREAVNSNADKFSLAEDEKLVLHKFLNEVANSPLKVKILQLFLNDPGLNIASYYLAEQLRLPAHDVLVAVKQLAHSGAMRYIASFGFSDLCALHSQFLSPTMAMSLGILAKTLCRAPEVVWQHWK